MNQLLTKKPPKEIQKYKLHTHNKRGERTCVIPSTIKSLKISTYKLFFQKEPAKQLPYFPRSCLLHKSNLEFFFLSS